MWLLAWHYLGGARRFDVFDPNTGALSPHYLDEDGNMEFQSQEMLSSIDRVSGRLASLDLRPKVMRQGISLNSIKERSLAQIVMDHVVSNDQLDKVKTQFAHIFTSLGSCGIAGHVIDSKTIGLTSDLEVIHPRELFPFPSLGTDYTKAKGLMRQRTVPLEFLEEMFGKSLKKNLKKMEWWKSNIGEAIQDASESDGTDVANSGGRDTKYWSDIGQGKADPDKKNTSVVKIRELWTFGVGDTVARYVVTSGEHVLYDEEFEDQEVYCPIGFARFIENGTFHGAGLFDLLFSLNREMERLLKSLFNNVRDTDRYGVLVMPQGQFNDRAMLRDVGQGLRVLPFEPDPVVETFRPFNITPFNSGDIPGKTAAFAKDLIDRMNPVQDLIREKGRVDSAVGLSFLDEQINKAMTNPSRGIEQAFSGCYRSILAGSIRELMSKPIEIPVADLNLEMAGAVIDAEKSSVQFQGMNPLPSLKNVSVTIKETSPRSKVARKQEAMEMLKAGVSDPDAFKILILKEGLDFALWMDEEKAAYDMIVRNCLVLYGDGEQPGQIVMTPHTAKPEFQLRVLVGFMSGPIMSIASTEVQNEFIKLKQFMMESTGAMMPEGIPSPMEAAMMQQQGMGQGGPMPFPQQGAM
tara:strand:+ start:2303 stop:4204 length:1902 start_codon:yes stop_codon:yes gene_type:complete